MKCTAKGVCIYIYSTEHLYDEYSSLTLSCTFYCAFRREWEQQQKKKQPSNNCKREFNSS